MSNKIKQNVNNAAALNPNVKILLKNEVKHINIIITTTLLNNTIICIIIIKIHKRITSCI